MYSGTIAIDSALFSSCDLVFPRAGDLYHWNASIYILYICNLNEETYDMLVHEKREVKTRIEVFAGNEEEHFVEGLFYNIVEAYGVTRRFALETKLYFGHQGLTGFPVKLIISPIIHDFVIERFLLTVLFAHPTQFDYNYKLKVDQMEVRSLLDLNEVDQHGDLAFSLKHENTGSRNIDFIEIGTSFFETMSHSAKNHTTGISIEPIKIYQDSLLIRPNIKKISAAVSVVSTWADVYYFPPDFLLSLSNNSMAYKGFFGMGCLNKIHPMIIMSYPTPTNVYKKSQLFSMRRDVVPIKTIQQVYEENDLHMVGILKTDCESHDVHIINSALDFYDKSKIPSPCIIEFEAIEVGDTTVSSIFNLIVRLQQTGYRVFREYEMCYNYDKQWDNSNIYAIHKACNVTYLQELEQLLSNGAIDRSREKCSNVGEGVLCEYCSSYRESHRS